MTAYEYLREKWPASAKRWAAIAAIGVPVLGLVKAQNIAFGPKLFGLLMAAFLIVVAFTWTLSAITLYLAGMYQASGRQLPDWASKDAYGED